MKRRILAIEDNPKWIANFHAGIPENLASIEDAMTADEARRLLRLRHYDLVLLDLSMTADPRNRDNDKIQDYLSLGEEQMRYIIVSGTVQHKEIRDSAYRRNAFDVLFKEETTPQLLWERASAALDTLGDWRSRFFPVFRKLLLRDDAFETEVVSALQPRGGVVGLSSAMEHLARSLAPIAPHSARRSFEIWDGAVLGLTWSRQQGEACSIALAKEHVSGEELTGKLTDWLGFGEREPLFEERVMARLRIQCFREHLSDEHFELPKV